MKLYDFLYNIILPVILHTLKVIISAFKKILDIVNCIIFQKVIVCFFTSIDSSCYSVHKSIKIQLCLLKMNLQDILYLMSKLSVKYLVNY